MIMSVLCAASSRTGLRALPSHLSAPVYMRTNTTCIRDDRPRDQMKRPDHLWPGLLISTVCGALAAQTYFGCTMTGMRV